jgi:hypothetical protein
MLVGLLIHLQQVGIHANVRSLLRYCCCCHQIVAYESLLRRLLRKAPDAALLAFDTFAFTTYEVAKPNGRGTLKAPMPYFNSGTNKWHFAGCNP